MSLRTHFCEKSQDFQFLRFFRWKPPSSPIVGPSPRSFRLRNPQKYVSSHPGIAFFVNFLILVFQFSELRGRGFGVRGEAVSDWGAHGGGGGPGTAGPALCGGSGRRRGGGDGEGRMQEGLEEVVGGGEEKRRKIAKKMKN